MVLFSHHEYIGDVISSSTIAAFLLQQFAINPGQSLLFPWLSTIAGNFVNYLFEELELVFVSTSTVALSTTTQQLGVAGGRCVMDPTLPVDNGMQQLLNSHNKVISSPAKSWSIRFPCSENAKGSYTIRTGAQPANTDLRMYDIGYFEVFTNALAVASQDIGQLHVKYKVHLFKPQYVQGLIGYTIRSAYFKLAGMTQAAPLTGASSTTLSTACPNSDFIGMTITAAGAITFPISVTTGNFIIVWHGYVAATTTFVATQATFNANCRSTTQPGGAAAIPNTAINSSAVTFQGSSPNQAGAATTEVGLIIYCTVDAPGTAQATVTINLTTLGTTLTLGSLLIQQINGNLATL